LRIGHIVVVSREVEITFWTHLLEIDGKYEHVEEETSHIPGACPTHTSMEDWCYCQVRYTVSECVSVWVCECVSVWVCECVIWWNLWCFSTDTKRNKVAKGSSLELWEMKKTCSQWRLWRTETYINNAM
jgi:hypothetical protein